MSDTPMDTDGAVSSPRRRRPYFVPGLIAIVALLAIGAALGAGDLSHPADRVLDGANISEQISLGIQAQENSRTPPDVTCPAHEPVQMGGSFTCRVTEAGHPVRTVYVREADSRGRVVWSFQPPAQPG